MSINKLIFTFLIIVTGCSTPKKEEIHSPNIPNPKSIEQSTNDVVLDHKYFVLSYNKTHRLANWVKYNLKKIELNGPAVRLKKFKPDSMLSSLGLRPVVHDDYTHSGYARGHLAPAEDFSRSQDAMDSTFIMSNVIPQKGSVNSGSWSQLEKKVRSWACGEESITVITGPLLSSNLQKIKGTDISVPERFFKIIIDESAPKKSIAFVYDQISKKQTVSKNKISVNEIKLNVGITEKLPEDSKLEDWKECI